MSKRSRTEGISLQYRRDIGISSPEAIAQQMVAGNNVNDFYQIDTAEVIDVIYTPDHPDFISNEDIGKVKIRINVTQKGTDETELSWAWPINPYIVTYPVKHEVVYVLSLLGKYFYLGNVNYFNNINNNVLPGISETPVRPNDDNKDSYQHTQTTTPKSKENNIELGDTFVDNNKKVKPLLPKEGDVIIRGRFGNNIRLGNNTKTNTPNIKISVSQDPNVDKSTELTHYEENINTTPNSIWITTDEVVKIDPITKGSSYYLKSAINASSVFDGNEIIINTDRIIWNAKKNETFIFANKGIALNTNGYVAIDCQDAIGITTLNKLNIQSKSGMFVDAPSINLGKDAKEPIVLGNKLVEILGDLIDAILQQTHPTGSGPSGTPINAAAFKIIKNKLSRTILSKQNHTV